MTEPSGPFKIVLSELAQSSPDTLGNPAAESVKVELARLFNLDDAMASSIVSAVPIIVLDNLSARTAGIVRERLQGLLRAGCKITTTDDPSDTIPRVNWPEMPAIAQVSDDEADPLPSAQTTMAGNGAFHCPNCQTAFQVVPAGGAPAPTAAPVGRSVPARSAPPPPQDFQGLDTAPGNDHDDWMNPPVSRVAPIPEEDSAPQGSARFDNAALLAYRQAEAGAAAPPPAQHTPPPPPRPRQEQLEVTFSDSGDQLQPVGSSADPFEASASSFEAVGTLPDSGSDILDATPPGLDMGLAGSAFDDGGFQDDFNLLDPEPAPAAAPAAIRSSSSAHDLDDLPLLEDSGDLGMGTSSSRARDVSADFAELLESEEKPPSRRAAGRAAGRGAGSRAAGAREPDLDEVLRMFGPEDEKPLDDMAGLEPQPLDLNPRSRGATRSRAASRDPFDEASDILEPLNPSEAMEIIKSQKGRSRGRSSRGGGGAFESLEPNEEDSLDIFGESQAPRRSSRAKKKKTRGVPFSASDEDLILDEGTRGRRSSRKSGSAARKRTDPFARARRAMEEEEQPAAREDTGGGRTREGRNGRSSRKRKGASRRVKRGGGGGGGAAPKGDGDHGLVLSRISDPDKKDKAAELIAEIKGCSMADAQRLTERTIIPVLKGVSRDVAEFHLDKFKRFKIAGRVTTRQRS